MDKWNESETLACGASAAKEKPSDIQAYRGQLGMLTQVLSFEVPCYNIVHVALTVLFYSWGFCLQLPCLTAIGSDSTRGCQPSNFQPSFTSSQLMPVCSCTSNNV